MTQKQFYESPSAELLVVRFEENFCASPNGAWDNSIQSGSTWDADNIDYGLE